MIGDDISYLVAGVEPIVPPADQPPSAVELAVLAERDGSFDWLADEPDLYSLDDGEPL